MSIREFLSEIIRDSQLIHQENQTAVETYYSTALRLLNGVIKSVNLDKTMIAYRSSYSFNFVQKQTIYNVNFVEIDIVYFLLSGSVKFILERNGLYNFILKSPVVNSEGPPSIFRAEPKPDFTIDIHVYLPPSVADQCTVLGKQALQQFSLTDAYPAILDAYRNYLKWETADQLRTVFNHENAGDPVFKQYAQREKENLRATKDLDATIKIKGFGRGSRNPFGAQLFSDGYYP